MPHFSLALLPGDGIGPEVTAAAVRVIEAVAADFASVKFGYTEYSVGAGEYLKHGDPLPPATVEALKTHDAILLGAMGLPSVRWPNGVEMTPQIDLRELLDLYQGVRPIRLYNVSHSPLLPAVAEGIDFVLVRENCEGLFAARKETHTRTATEARDTMRITRHGAERICRAAFKIAEKRQGRVTLVDKANVLPSMAFFRAVFDDVAREFPEIQTEHVYVDAMALFLVQKPSRFDVMVTENMFGDILSDLAAGLVGGMGMAPSADLGDRYGLFQPSHGSAPTIAGQGIANPVATILSAAMMLEWLGHEETIAGARRIEAAVSKVFSDSTVRTTDLGGTLGTSALTDRILSAL
jgi:3-isopropylmalate dehydrogenase